MPCENTFVPPDLSASPFQSLPSRSVQYERQMEQMRLEHAREIRVRDDKITFLKKQISESLKDNSW